MINNTITKYVAIGLTALGLAYNVANADEGKLPVEKAPILQKKVAEIKKEEPKQTAPTVITVQSKDSLENILGEMNTKINDYESNIAKKQKETEDLKTNYKFTVNSYANKLSSIADKLKESADFLKGKMTDKKQEIVNINVNQSPLELAIGVNQDNRINVLTYTANANIYVGADPVQMLGIEFGYGSANPSVPAREVTSNLGNGFTASGKTEYKSNVEKISLLGKVYTGFPFRDCSLGLSAGAVDYKTTITRKEIEQILKNGNVMSKSSHEKIDDPKHDTSFIWGPDVNIKLFDKIYFNALMRMDKDFKVQEYGGQLNFGF